MSTISFQRVGSVSNTHVGSDFEETAQRVFDSQGLHLVKAFSLPVGVGKKKKEHRFDLGSADHRIVVECKSHKWTVSGNVPSAKMTVWNEAMYYFAVAPEGYRKILFVLRDYSQKKNETLAEYYIRTHDHLIPNGVEIWEFDEGKEETVIWKDTHSQGVLEKAFEAAFQLPKSEQDAVAEWLLIELASEEQWDERFAGTQDALSELAREALAEDRRGGTEDLKPESL